MSSLKSARRHIPRVAAVALTGAVATTALAGSAGAIVNGEDSTERYPFMTTVPVTSVDYPEFKGACGGSLIDRQWVLTAAHCVVENRPQGYVRVGSAHRTSGGTVRTIKKVVVHPAYRNGEGVGPNVNDVALLRLDRPVPGKAIRIADRPGRPGTPTRLLGFGTVSEDPDPTKWVFPERLQQLDTRIGAARECAPGWAGDTRLCTISRKPKAMACNGDSGGPQVKRGRGGRWELVGVTSGPGAPGVPCSAGPGLYSSAPAYAPWIWKTVGAGR